MEQLLRKESVNFGKGKGKGKESFPKIPKRNRKGKFSKSMSGKGKGTLSTNFRKVSTTACTRPKVRKFFCPQRVYGGQFNGPNENCVHVLIASSGLSHRKTFEFEGRLPLYSLLLFKIYHGQK